MAAEPKVDKAQIKRLLTLSKKEPVSCAVAQGADPQFGLLLLDKIKQPKALERDLLKANPEARNQRFGSAEVDIDIDPKLVRFRLNKPAQGIARRLVKTLKGTGFSKVEIVMEDGTVVESAGEAEDGEETEAQATAPIPDAPPPPPQPSVQAPVQPPAPGIDAGKLGLVIAALVKRLQSFAGDPNLRTNLVKLAQEAGGKLKAGELEAALRAAEALRTALDAPAPVQNAPGSPTAPQQPPPEQNANGTPPISPVKLGKASLLWRGMWAKADKDLQSLHDAVIAAMQEDEDVEPEDYANIQTNIASVAALTQRLNISLADDLDRLINARPDAVEQVRRRLDEFQDYLESDEIVGLLADNEFHPVSVKADLLKAVQTIRGVVAGG